MHTFAIIKHCMGAAHFWIKAYAATKANVTEVWRKKLTGSMNPTGTYYDASVWLRPRHSDILLGVLVDPPFSVSTSHRDNGAHCKQDQVNDRSHRKPLCQIALTLLMLSSRTHNRDVGANLGF